VSSSWPRSIRHDLRYLAAYTPAAGVALVIAENFYKFHSFTLEWLAFLGTATVLHVVGRTAIGVISDLQRPSGGGRPGASS
jgi:hypothetical protein